MGKGTSLSELIGVITRVIGQFEEKTMSKFEEMGLTPRQLAYIDAIARLGNPSFTELAEHLHLSKPSITAIINKLSEQDYVQVVKSDEDRRSSHIHLGKKGEQVIAMHDKIHQEIAGVFTDNLSDREVQQLVAILNKIVARG